MDVRKTNGTYEEFDNEKLKRGIRQAYIATGQQCPEEVVVSITDNLYIYDKISSQEIRRQVVESLMSINKKAALEYIERFDSGLDLRKKRDFIKDYINASNAATGSKFDANANITRKNIVTLGQELYKENNIKQNRYIMRDKIKSLYGREMADRYVADLESHVLYNHYVSVPGERPQGTGRRFRSSHRPQEFLRRVHQPGVFGKFPVYGRSRHSGVSDVL